MGKRARRKRARRRRRPAPSPPPPPGTLYVGICRWLGHFGIISVLFETPSGFAVLHYDGVKLFRRNALEYIWSEFIDMSGADKAISFKEFQIFEDNASAINSDGVCSELAEMIKRSLRPGQKLAVGKQEYKDIIEASLGIHCLFDEAVLEVMWGLKNLIKMLVPDEKLELTNEDRLQISRGMKSVLDRHCVEVDANLVNSDIIVIASTVYECDRLVGARDALLQHYGNKLAVMLSRTEAEKLVADADRYEDKLNKRTCLDMYQKIVWGYGIRYQALAQLGSMVKEAKKGLKLHQGPMVKEAE